MLITTPRYKIPRTTAAAIVLWPLLALWIFIPFPVIVEILQNIVLRPLPFTVALFLLPRFGLLRTFLPLRFPHPPLGNRLLRAEQFLRTFRCIITPPLNPIRVQTIRDPRKLAL
jgi:hypothetical protein